MTLLEISSSAHSQISMDDSIAGLIKKQLEKEIGSTPLPQNYFWITDVVNPSQAYWGRKKPGIEVSKELAQKFAYGKKIGRIAKKWFEPIGNFIFEETKLNGSYVGIPGIIGKIDFRIDKSLIEFKTKEDTIDKIEIILEKYPQDLEQLLFYTVLYPNASNPHYLVFHNKDLDNPFRVFKVLIKRKGIIKDALTRRMDLLRRSIDEENTEKLGQCRYINYDCQYKSENICNCEDIDKLNIDWILKSIDIDRDEGMEKELFENSKKKDIFDLFYINNLFLPMKYVAKERSFDTTEYVKTNEQIQKDMQVGLLEQAVFNVELIRLNYRQWPQMTEEAFANDIYSRSKWIKIKGNKPSEEYYIPYIVKTGNYAYPRKPSNLPGYWLSEMATICSLYKSEKGAIIVGYPRCDFEVGAYIVQYEKKTIKEIRRQIRSTIKDIQKAVKTGNVIGLDECPDWVSKDCTLECDYRDKCK